jgi:hypothetical protein
MICASPCAKSNLSRGTPSRSVPVTRTNVVDPGMAGFEPVAARDFEARRTCRALAAGGAAPLGHVGMLGDLAVNRPGGAVIVRRRLAGAGIDMGEDDKAQLGVFVKGVAAGRGR